MPAESRFHFCLYARDLDALDALDRCLILLIEIASKQTNAAWTA